MKTPFTYAALRIAIIYCVISALWIFFSDTVVSYISTNIETLNYLQTIKGWFFVFMTSLLIFYLINNQLSKEKKLTHNIKKSKQELEHIIQQAPNPMMVYNEDGKIILMNKMWLKLTKYEFEEIDTIDKWLRKAYKEKSSDIKKIAQEMYSISQSVDNGIYKLYTKSNEVIVWHFNSAPFGMREGKRTVIASAIDITELEAKNQLIMQQSKMAALGEMIENIAHQWRQPLSSISSLSTGIQLKKENNDLSDEYLDDSLQTINFNAQYLSHTIDDFRSFFEKDSHKNNFNVKNTVLKALKLLKYKLKDTHIQVQQKFDDVNINSFENELIQVVLNLFNNSLDAFETNHIQHKIIIAEVIKEKSAVKIQLTDSAGGIKEEILSKIFEPYFTTKHKSQGTGIGLYMCEEIISKHMKGSIQAQNIDFEHNKEVLKGARFTIILPLELV